jgi:hypothetical protein
MNPALPGNSTLDVCRDGLVKLKLRIIIKKGRAW